jgi:hypothetical protein
MGRGVNVEVIAVHRVMLHRETPHNAPRRSRNARRRPEWSDRLYRRGRGR